MNTPYTFPMTMIVISFLIAFWCFFHYILPMFIQEVKSMHPKADRKPTKKEIAERNHIDWLLMPDELEEGNPIIKLHETEKAIS